MLDFQDKFLVTKRSMKGGLMGAEQFMTSRASIAQGQLHLNRWHGFQEIRSRGPVPETINIRGAFAPDGEVDLFWVGKSGMKEGIRIRKENPVHWKNNSSGAWEMKSTFPVTLKNYFNNPIRSFSASFQKEILPNTGFEISLTFNQKMIKIRQADKKITTFPVSEMPLSWGLQGNGKSVVIDEIRENNFTNDFEAPYQTKLFLCLAPLLLLPFFFPRIFYPAYAFFFALLSVWVIDRFHYSHFQIDTFNPNRNESQALLNFEPQRFSFFQKERTSLQLKSSAVLYPRDTFFNGPIYCESAICRPVEYREIPAKKGPRILFVGSSQTIGSGADKVENSFFALTHRILSKKIPGLESLNISQSGAEPQIMLMYFKAFFPEWNPDYVVINLGYNNSYFNKKYDDPIREMFQASTGKKVFLMNEAFLDHPQWAGKLIKTNIRLAAENHSTIIDLYGYLLKLTAKKEAHLWWDNVHLNNLGHIRAGHFIADQISDNLNIKSSGKADYTDVKL